MRVSQPPNAPTTKQATPKTNAAFRVVMRSNMTLSAEEVKIDSKVASQDGGMWLDHFEIVVVVVGSIVVLGCE
jgi:hypothetical protein